MERNLNCEQMWDLLSVYADGECTPDECAVVERHIAICSVCAGHLAILRQMAAALVDTEEVTPPPGLRDAILAATIHRPSWSRRLRDALSAWMPSSPVRAVAAAAAAAVIAMAVFLGRAPAPRVVASAPKAPLSSLALHVSNAPTREEPVGKPAKSTLPDERRVASNSAHQAVQARVASTVTQRPVHTRPTYDGGYGGQSITRSSARIVRVMPKLSPLALEPPADMPDESEAAMPDIAPMNPIHIAETGKSPSGEYTNDSAEPRPLVFEGSRVMIANAGPPISAGTVASLADLRRALRRQNGTSPVASVPLPFEDEKLVTVDVFRTRF